MAAIDARDRIGFGPWYNAKGVEVASTLNALHSDFMNLGKENSLDENGNQVKGRGDSPNEHDILTGSSLAGNAIDDGEDHTCNNWTSNSAEAHRSATLIAKVAVPIPIHGIALTDRAAVARQI